MDFESTVLPVTFEAVSEDIFSPPYVSCGVVAILEDKLAFEGDEVFVVNLLPGLLNATAMIGQNGTANVTIQDNDRKE